MGRCELVISIVPPTAVPLRVTQLTSCPPIIGNAPGFLANMCLLLPLSWVTRMCISGHKSWFRKCEKHCFREPIRLLVLRARCVFSCQSWNHLERKRSCIVCQERGGSHLLQSPLRSFSSCTQHGGGVPMAGLLQFSASAATRLFVWGSHATDSALPVTLTHIHLPVPRER